MKTATSPSQTNLPPAARKFLGEISRIVAVKSLIVSVPAGLAIAVFWAAMLLLLLQFSPASWGKHLGLLAYCSPLPVLLAILWALHPLYCRRGMAYVSALAERHDSRFRGYLILLTEGSSEDPGVIQLAQEHVEKLLADVSPQKIARTESLKLSRLIGSASCLLLACGLLCFSLVPGQNSSDPQANADQTSSAINSELKPAIVIKPGGQVSRILLTHPAYTGQDPEEIIGPNIDCLRGSKLNFMVTASGPVNKIYLRLKPTGSNLELSRLPGKSDSWQVSFPVNVSGGYQIDLVLGNGSRLSPLSGNITARRDLPPNAYAAIRTTDAGRLVLDYRVSDDYRLAKAKVVFSIGNTTQAFALPRAKGKREAQGSALIPSTVLNLAGSSGFLFNLVATDNCTPKANTCSTRQQRYLPPQQIAALGPLPGNTFPNRIPDISPRTGQGQEPDSSGSETSTTTRPLSALHKPGQEDGTDKSSDPDQPRSKKGSGIEDNEFVAPSSGETAPEKQPETGNKKPGPSNPDQRSPEPNPGNPDKSGKPGTEKKPGKGDPQKSGRDQGDPRKMVNTPGAPSASSPSPSGGGQSGNNTGNNNSPKPPPPNHKPTGQEKGSSRSPREFVIPELATVEVKPNVDSTARAGKPEILRTNWGQKHPASEEASQDTGQARKPTGSITITQDRFPEPDNSTLGRSLPGIPERYRKMVISYLKELAAESR
jgi:hypothetical protein